MAVVVVYCVFADAAEANRVARQLVEERLAACANLLGPCQSVYRWEGEVQAATEAPAIFKTDEAVAEALIARLAELHSYDVPAIAAWPATAVPNAYVQWVAESIG